MSGLRTKLREVLNELTEDADVDEIQLAIEGAFLAYEEERQLWWWWYTLENGVYPDEV